MTHVPDRHLVRLSRVLWWLVVASLLGVMGLAAAEPGPIEPAAVATGGGFLLVLLPFPISGLLILRRQPRNSVGWLLSAIGAVWAIGGLADSYTRLERIVAPGSLPDATVAAVLPVSSLVWAPALGLTGTFLLLLFPDGHLPSARWRPLALLSGAVLVVLTLVLYVAPGPLVAGAGQGRPNPMGVEALRPVADAALGALILLLALCILASAVALVLRFRRAVGIERQQLKWLAAAAAIVGTAFVVGIVTSMLVPDDQPEPTWQLVLDQLNLLLFALLPIAIGVAVLRYRLYDIDTVVNRALVYGTLTATLVATYLGSVLLLQLVLRPLTRESDLAVAGSTLAVAALFGPARGRIQALVDRRFYRRRYDAALTVTAFTGRLRQQVDLDAVGAELVAAVRETVEPATASIWLPPRGRPS